MKPAHTLIHVIRYTPEEIIELSDQDVDKILTEKDIEIDGLKRDEKNMLVLKNCPKQEKEYHLAKETFEVLAMASAGYFEDGNVQLAKSGSLFFDALYMSNQEPLEQIKEDVQLYHALCFQAGNILEWKEVQIKKN